MGKVVVKNLKLFNGTGYFGLESSNGREIIVNMEVGYDFDKVLISKKLEDTVDYGKLCNLIKNEFQKKHGLLEIVASEIQKSVLENYPNVESFFIRIEKMSPFLIGTEVESTAIELEWKKNDDNN